MGTSWATSATARKVMQGNRGRDTKPELAVRRLVHARGMRYRVNARVEPDLRRTADLLFSRARIAVFVDGCYWHGCPEHFSAPKSNVDFWQAKIARNRDRDAETTALLQERGWTVLRFWSHEPAVDVADRIDAAVRPGAAERDVSLRRLLPPNDGSEPSEETSRSQSDRP